MANRIEPKLTEPDANIEAVEKALTNFTPDKNYAPREQRGIHELFEEAERNHAAQGELLKIIKTRLEHFSRMQSDFYNGKS